MKTHPYSHSLPLLAGLAVLVAIGFSFRTKEKELKATASLAELVDAGKVSVVATSKGGYRGNCLNLELTNHTGAPLAFRLQEGRRFLSDNVDEQDILIVKSEEMRLAAGENANFDGYGFCCQANYASPSTGGGYQIGPRAPADWMPTLQLMDTVDYPMNVQQHAVWVLSDHHEISSVGYEDIDSLRLLHEELAAVREGGVPWYQSVYAETEDRVWSGDLQAIRATIPYYFDKDGTVTIAVRNRYDHVVYLLKRHPVKAGQHKYELDLSVAGLEKGTYTFYIYQDLRTLLTRQDFKV